MSVEDKIIPEKDQKLPVWIPMDKELSRRICLDHFRNCGAELRRLEQWQAESSRGPRGGPVILR